MMRSQTGRSTKMIKLKTVVVTPEIASKWLSTGGANRTLSQSHVDKLGRDMKANKWRLNGETVIISEEGKLLDGQHRCQASVQYNASFETVVVEGVAASAIHVINTGKPRSVAQILGMLGEADPIRLAAVAKAAQVALSGMENAPPLSITEVEKILRTHPGVRWIMQQKDAASSLKTSVAPVLAGFALCYEKHPSEAERLWPAYTTGADLKSGNPLLALRNFVINHATRRKHMGSLGQMGRNSLTRRTLTALYYCITDRPLLKSSDGLEGQRYFVGEANRREPKAPTIRKKDGTLIRVVA